MATEIRIDNTGDGTWYLYNGNNAWKDYVCEDFDDKIIVTGNRDYTTVGEPEWWHRAKEIIDDLDSEGTMDIDIDDMVDYYKYTKESIQQVIKAYDECRYSDDIDFVAKVAKILTGKKIVTRQISGYTQSEWNYIAYDEDEFENDPTEIIEAYYFGKVSDITVNTDEDEYGDVITHDELWEAERNGNLKDYFRKRYELPENEEIKILQCDGYKQVADWKEVI